MKSEKIMLIVVCVLLALFGILFGMGFVSTTTASYSKDQYTEQTCTFLTYEYEVWERKGADWESYEIYVQEYAKPLQIDNLVFDQVNRHVLNDLKQGDQITVLLDKKQNVISMEYQGRYVLTYEDYAAEHENNNTVGVIVTLILSCACWGVIIFLIVHYIKTGRVSDVLPRRF